MQKKAKSQALKNSGMGFVTTKSEEKSLKENALGRNLRKCRWKKFSKKTRRKARKCKGASLASKGIRRRTHLLLINVLSVAFFQSAEISICLFLDFNISNLTVRDSNLPASENFCFCDFIKLLFKIWTALISIENRLKRAAKAYFLNSRRSYFLTMARPKVL